MGVPPSDSEDLTSIAMRIFAVVKCNVTAENIFGCYRVKKGNTPSNIFIVKLNDYNVKHQILKSKSGRGLKVKDVIDGAFSDGNAPVYINNHVTPFFGRLLAEGLKAVRDNKLLSVWLAKDGCRIRLEENGNDRIFRSVN